MKKWYQSKIIWINILSIILEVLNVLMTNPIIPAKYAGLMTVIVNIITIGLRFISTTFIANVSDCLGVKDTVTNLWLTSWDFGNNTPFWDNERQAYCFTLEQRNQILAVLNADGNARFIGGRPSGRP